MLAVGCGIQLSRAVCSSYVLELLNLHFSEKDKPTQTIFVVLVCRRSGEGKIFSVAVLS